MSPSKILVTGATGFIGSRLCERLTLDYNLPYRVLVRSFAHAPRVARLGADMMGGDLDNRASIDKALNGCDTVVHLAYSHSTGSQTRNLIQACRKRGIKRFVHISSISVHGPDPGPECTQEETAKIGRYPGEDYSNAKAAAELVVHRAIRDGLGAVILRPTIVYGPYGGFVTSIVETVRKLGLLTLLDEGRGICNAVYVDDVCDAIRAAVETEQGLGNAFFITADRAVTWREFNLAFAGMVVPPPQIISVSSDEVRRYWASQKPTLKSNITAFGRLMKSVDFYRQLSTVPILATLITGGKQAARTFLSPDRVAALNDLQGTSLRNQSGARLDNPWPDSGRVTRECQRIQFSNERARNLLGWRPRYDLPAGAAVTRSWLESANMLSAGEVADS